MSSTSAINYLEEKLGPLMTDQGLFPGLKQEWFRHYIEVAKRMDTEQSLLTQKQNI